MTSRTALNTPVTFIRDGKRVIGYDNAERKGDHKHYFGNEHQYRFKGIDELIEDFSTMWRFRDEG